MTYREAMDKAAKDYLSEVMTSVGGKILQAARIAGCDRAYFYTLLKRHGLNYWDFRPNPYPVGRPRRDAAVTGSYAQTSNTQVVHSAA